ncbi:MAG: hypothetical protein U0359_24055 [Byssovorax sp.]
MHDLYDNFGKAIGASALVHSGNTEIEPVLAPDARRADIRHDPDPTKDAEREKLGLLGRIAAVVCLIELYSGAPTGEDALACLTKLLTFRQQRRRDAERARDGERKRLAQESPDEPSLAELGTLGDDAYEHVVADQIVLNLQQVLGSKPSST